MVTTGLSNRRAGMRTGEVWTSWASGCCSDTSIAGDALDESVISMSSIMPSCVSSSDLEAQGSEASGRNLTAFDMAARGAHAHANQLGPRSEPSFAMHRIVGSRLLHGRAWALARCTGSCRGF